MKSLPSYECQVCPVATSAYATNVYNVKEDVVGETRRRGEKERMRGEKGMKWDNRICKRKP